MIYNSEGVEYYNYNKASFINIPDAAGRRFTFDVSHFDEGGEEEFGTFEQPAQLDIYVNNDSIASVSHESNKDNSIADVTCDDACNCIFQLKADV